MGGKVALRQFTIKSSFLKTFFPGGGGGGKHSDRGT